MRKHDEYIVELGKILRSLRQKKGLTLEEAEEVADIDWKWLQKVEQGKKDIQLSSIITLCTGYKIQPATLFKKLKIRL
jgi:transcriptional regulator with XRE-family HTH domain